MVSRPLINSKRFKCIPFFLFAFKRFSPGKFDVMQQEDAGPRIITFGPRVHHVLMLQNNSGQPALGFNGAGGLWVGSSDQREPLNWTQVPLHRSTCAPGAPPPAMRADLHVEERGPSLRTLLFLHVGNTPPTRLSTPVCPGEEALSQRRPNLPVPRNQTGGICVFSRSHRNNFFEEVTFRNF